MFVFEHRSEPLLPRAAFHARVRKYSFRAAVLMAIALGMGMVGYRITLGLDWDDSFMNAAMILSGMGPVAVPKTPIARIFAGSYALFSGVVFLALATIVLAPFLHRFLHRFHLDQRDIKIAKVTSPPGASKI